MADNVDSSKKQSLTEVAQFLSSASVPPMPVELESHTPATPSVVSPASKQTPPPSSITCRFLSLPAELRNTVYRDLLQASSPLLLIHDRPVVHFWHRENATHKRIHVDVLRTNKEIHAEASSVLYEQNTWILMTRKLPREYEHQISENSATNFILPSPLLHTYMSKIRRVAIIWDSEEADRMKTKAELTRELAVCGIAMHDLHLFAIHFPTSFEFTEKHAIYHSWLAHTDVSQLRRKYIWFPDERPSSTLFESKWMVMK